MKKLKQQVILIFQARRSFSAVIVVAVLLVGAIPTALVRADTVSQLQAQVDSLNTKNAQNQQQVASLESQATNYQDAINKLSSRIVSIQSQIGDNQTKQAQLTTGIQTKQQELDEQKQALGDDLKAMYVAGQMSTMEMLATSKNLSDYVNAATYSSAVQNKIQSTLDKITTLKNELEVEQTKVQELLVTLAGQQKDVSVEESQQNQLLGWDQDQQASYNTQIAANQSQISSLQQKIVEANLPQTGNVYYGSACDSSHGDTYPSPLCSSAQDSIIDQWGLYNRECVSYVAWKEYSNGKYVPYGLGNAGDWPSNVPGSWIDKTPQQGDAAVRPAIPGYGFWEGGQWVADVGHVMYIEHVNADGTIAVSQYNASLNGEYSYVPSRSTSGLVFIHFPNAN